MEIEPDGPLQIFHELVRDCFRAEEGFDNWDGGVTFYPSSLVRRKGRKCSLDTVVREWREANAKLIQYVREHGDEILKENENGQADQGHNPGSGGSGGSAG